MHVSSVAEHYAELLAPVYLWMSGGLASALARGAAEVSDFGGEGGLAVDLGAGFGAHAIALARAGWNVVAIDASATLLAELARSGAGLPIRAVHADLLDFASHLPAPPSLMLCMGDTLTHLATESDVEALLQAVAAALAPGGCFVATFRDHTAAPHGTARFIPVRADAERLLTCFVESTPERVIVHDILHERRGQDWTMRVGAYPKLRLAPAFVRGVLERAGLAVTLRPAPHGMLRIEARA
jgi:SAM-dependent methyltransferase